MPVTRLTENVLWGVNQNGMESCVICHAALGVSMALVTETTAVVQRVAQI